MTTTSHAPAQRPPDGLASALQRLACSKDAQAWSVLVHIAGPDVSRIAQCLIADPALAQDAIQETVLLLRDHAGMFQAHDGDREMQARRWIMRVTANASITLLRRTHSQRTRDQRAGASAALA
jgi:DNA-directed RNA polymerase specialized sigma24 family protein